MRPSSSALGACIWILVAASFLIFTLHYFVPRTTTRETLTLSLPIAHDLEGHAITDLMQQNNNHRLKSNEANPPLNVARRKLAMEMNLVGKYYDLYPSEMLIAMQGTFAGRSSRFSKDADGGCITEIVMNYDTSRAILSGIAYCNDMLVERKLSDSIRFITSNESNLHEPQFNVTKSQFSALSIEDLPEGFSVLKASDPRAIRTVTNVQKINPGSRTYNKDTLIVFTTCNHIDMTVLALEYLKHSVDVSDLVIVDDFSIDGTADYLVKKGYFVIKKDKPMGLTDSWNKGYQLAVSMGYHYVVFANNDVLIPRGAIHSMIEDLHKDVLVVPLSTMKGAGHNPGQTLVLALEMSADVEDYICNPNNVQIIQDALTKRVTEVASGKAPIGGKFDGEKGSKIGHDSMHASNLSIENRVLNSIWKTKPRFNGFVFAINISGIQPAAFHYPSVLFDPSGLIIGQEDKLIASMTELKLMPKISLGAFVYHFKSVTVKYTRNKKNQDAREDLSKYHPGPDNIGRATRESENLTPSDSTADAGQSLDFPVPLLPYANYGPMYMQKPFQRYSVYPPMNSDSGSDEEVQRKYDEGSSATLKKRETVIAFATSDAGRYPFAGDVFTAVELGKALTRAYEDVKIIYLYRGKDWYDAKKLQEVDVLVALLDAYDLGMALRSRQSWRQNDGPKPTMVSIGWSRNWFHRWLQQPWIGNYDLLLTSSTISKTFFDEFGKKFGHAVQCVHGCPMERAPTLICTTPAVPTGTPNKNDQGSAQIDSGNRISDFKNLSLLRSGQVELSCTISIHKVNSFGNNLLELTRFNYPYNLSDRYNVLMRPDPMLSQAIRFKPRYRQIARHRVQVPVKILRIGTNTETFVEKGHSVKDPIIVDKLAPSMDVFENVTENSVLNTSKDMTGRRTTNAGVKFIESTISRLSSEREEVLNSADYAFTGSYYHVPRNIMTFDPLDLLPQFKGVIIGSGWDIAPNISDEFRRIAIGSLSYGDLPKVYRKIKIVIDDANHVTSPWGSVNSRVFDALSSGALVLTNGLLGSHETFNGKLPTYKTSAELTSLIRYYLTNNAVRVNLIKELADLVRNNHSYVKRGEEMVAALADFGVKLKVRQAANQVSRSIPTRAICIGVRTYDSHRSWLEILLRSLVAQHSKSSFGATLDLQIFISDTERNTAFTPHSTLPASPFTFSHMLEEIVNRVNRDLNPNRSPQVHVVWDINAPKRVYKNPFYGYDETDNLVNFMADLPQCEWMMLTNGDNAYNSAWFNAIAPLANNNTIDLIGWDFITHHKRNGHGQQHIRVSMKRGFVDLASVLVRTTKVIESGARYLRDAMFTEDLFARDFYVLKDILKIVPPQAIRLLHRIFLLHQ